jgi:hypothetical protein
MKLLHTFSLAELWFPVVDAQLQRRFSAGELNVLY